MDHLSRCELHVPGQPRLRRHLDWRQLFVMSLRSLYERINDFERIEKAVVGSYGAAPLAPRRRLKPSKKLVY